MSVIAATLLAMTVAASAQADSVPAALSPADSIAVLKQARRAQSDFERRRFMLLPIVASTGGRCDVRVGRWCYWQDDADSAPPDPQSVIDLRARFLTRMATLASRLPGDRWISGQRVRYLSEAKRGVDAIAAVNECRAGTTWCASLAVLAYRAAHNIPAADSADDSAMQHPRTVRLIVWRQCSRGESRARSPCDDTEETNA